MGLWMIDDGFSDSQKKDTSASRFRVKVKTFTSPKIASLFHFLFIISSALSVKARVKVAAQEAERKYKSNAAVCCFFVYSFSSHPKSALFAFKTHSMHFFAMNWWKFRNCNRNILHSVKCKQLEQFSAADNLPKTLFPLQIPVRFKSRVQFLLIVCCAPFAAA